MKINVSCGTGGTATGFRVGDSDSLQRILAACGSMPIDMTVTAKGSGTATAFEIGSTDTSKKSALRHHDHIPLPSVSAETAVRTYFHQQFMLFVMT